MNSDKDVFKNWVNTVLQSKHILVSGRTGAGKTSVISILLSQAEDCAEKNDLNMQFVLIDPTKTELMNFANSHYTMIYNDDKTRALDVLNIVIKYIDERYGQCKDNPRQFDNSPIYVVVEHFEYLYAEYEKQIKTLIEQISVNGAGVNVHLIISDQYPSNLNNNIHHFETRIVLQVGSSKDSRLLFGDSKFRFEPEIGKGVMYYDGQVCDIAIPIIQSFRIYE